MGHKDKQNMDVLARELTAAFARWDHIHKYGGSDPFHADGVNLFLVRNHILYFKRQIEDLVRQEEETPTLFETSFPDIYYRDTPPEVSFDFMARADEIRARAVEQLSLYEQDPNFRFIRDHHEILFSKGETKDTKTAGIFPSITNVSRYRTAVETDDLVSMRSYFSVSYEKRSHEWAALASRIQKFLHAAHDQNNDPIVLDDDLHANAPDDSCFEKEEVHQSLDSILSAAKERSEAPATKSTVPHEEQITLF